jgi:hypothetical protein
MQPLFTMLLALRVGLVPGPGDGALLSIREEALQVARVVAERDTFVTHQTPRATSILSRAQVRIPDGQSWASPPALVADLQKQAWRDALADALNGNQTIANAAMWLASAPLRLKVSHEKVFVAITVRTP